MWRRRGEGVVTTARDAARRELRRGRQPIPVPLGQKHPPYKGWQNLILIEDDVDLFFEAAQNVGVLNGVPSGNQIDADLDCAEAVQLAPHTLPPTGAVFGRPGKPGSHRLYVCDPLPPTKQFKDVDGTMLLELRSTGTHTLFPPSIHPGGEEIAWEEDGEPAHVDGDALIAAAAWVASAVLLARHWPATGGRQDAALALAGGLHRLGWSEPEAAAFVTTVADAAGDEETGKRARTAEYTARRLAERRTATGWPRLAQSVGGQVVDRVREWLRARDSGNSEHCEEAPWEPPIPLAESPRPPFPTDVLPGWVRRWVEAEARATQTPPALAGMLGLSCLAAACAKTVIVRVTPQWTEPVNLFTATAMAPGERKSAVFADATRPIGDFEAAQLAERAPEIAEAEGRRKIAEQALTKVQKAAAEAVGPERAKLLLEADAQARDLAATKVPALPRLLADDCSPEKLASLLAEQGGRIAVMAPEGDVFELMGGRYSANGAPNFGVYLRGHAGDDLRVDRVGRRSEFVRAPALTIGLAIQPDIVAGLATKPGFRGRGLLARFLYVLPESLVGRRAIDPPPVPDDVREEYHRNLTALLGLHPSTRADAYGNPEPHALDLAADARQTLRSFRAALEPRLGEIGDLDHIRDWAGKLAGAVARVAGLLHMALHAVQEEPWARPIADTTMMAAIQLGTDFLVPHALAAFAQMGADPAMADAQYVLRVLGAHDLVCFTQRDLFQLVKGRFKTVEPLERALVILEEHGYARPLAPSHRSRPGRKPSPTFEVNPLWRAERAAPTTGRPPEGRQEEAENAWGSEAGASQNAQYSQNARLWNAGADSEDSENSEDEGEQEEVFEWAATL